MTGRWSSRCPGARKACIVFLLAVPVACAKEPPLSPEPRGTSATVPTSPLLAAAPSAAVAPLAGPDASPGPASHWSIHFDPGGTRDCTLRNHTGQPRWVLHDARLQPSRLQLVDAAGRMLPAFDERSRMKFDNTVRRGSFFRLDDGEEIPLFELRVVSSGARSTIQWGPYRISDVPAGTYTATVVFEALVDHHVDERTGEKRRMEGAFVGTIRSAPVPLHLPPPSTN